MATYASFPVCHSARPKMNGTKPVALEIRPRSLFGSYRCTLICLCLEITKHFQAIFMDHSALRRTDLKFTTR